MASPRRLRVLMYLVLAAVVTLLFFTSQARHARDSSVRDFYSKTVNAMDKEHWAGTGGNGGRAGQKVMADDDIDEDDALLSKQMAERLRQAEQKAKDIAKAKGPNKPEAPEQVARRNLLRRPRTEPRLRKPRRIMRWRRC